MNQGLITWVRLKVGNSIIYVSENYTDCLPDGRVFYRYSIVKTQDGFWQCRQFNCTNASDVPYVPNIKVGGEIGNNTGKYSTLSYAKNAMSFIGRKW